MQYEQRTCTNISFMQCKTYDADLQGRILSSASLEDTSAQEDDTSAEC